jgi:hypothetical protein
MTLVSFYQLGIRVTVANRAKLSGTTGLFFIPLHLTTWRATMVSGSGTEQWAWASGRTLIPTALHEGLR